LLACEQVSEDATYLIETESKSDRAASRNDKNAKVPINDVLNDQAEGVDGKKVVGKSLTRIRTMADALEESHVVGRENEKYDIINLVAAQATDQFQVISVWGMGGLGKTTLVKNVYHTMLSSMYEKHAFVTVMRPFSLVELLRSLVMQLEREHSEKKGVMGLMASTKNALLMTSAELIKELTSLLERKKCLIVLDDVSSNAEWDMIIKVFHDMGNTSRIIVTTRDEGIAKHCSGQQENIYKLKGLEDKDALDLFAKKVLNLGFIFHHLAVETKQLVLLLSIP
jgi:Ni2+-binding GTPase involved in maturation of urease and hydrogenase